MKALNIYLNHLHDSKDYRDLVLPKGKKQSIQQVRILLWKTWVLEHPKLVDCYLFWPDMIGYNKEKLAKSKEYLLP